MAKAAGKRTPKKAKKRKEFIPEKYQNASFIILLVISIIVFFWGPVSEGGGFNVSDNIASVSFFPFIEKSNDQGVFPLWVPYIFSGMPAYSSLLTTGARYWDIVPQIVFGGADMIGQVMSNDLFRVLAYYMILGIGMYLLMRYKEHSKFVSFFTAFATIFSTGIIIWVMIGHNTKPIAFMMFPYIILLLERIREKFTLMSSVLLIFAVHVLNESNHIQMIFYAVITFALYLIFELVSRMITKNEPMKVLRAAAVLFIAGVLSFVMSSDRYLSTLQYNQYSTRGTAPIMKTADQQQTESGGHDYDYATMWSFSPQEISTFFVPNFYGFGKVDYEGPATGGEEMKLMTYWGQKPFEDAAPYMGIIILWLAIIGGIYYRKVIFVQFLIVLALFSLLLSFGSTFPLIYDFFYYNVPAFNKFRAPSMALAMMQFAVPVLAGYGLTSLIKMKKEKDEKAKKYGLGGLVFSGAFLVLGFIYSAAFKSTYIDAVANNKITGRYPESIHDFVFSNMISDWYTTAFILLIATVLIYLYIRNNINKTILFPALAILLVFDLWRVDYRPMDYSENTIEEEYFGPKDVFDFIKQDQGLYRIADFASPSPNMASYYFLENVNGYHAAKLRVYQDVLDVANQIEPGSTSNLRNELLWDMLNVKYIVTDQELSGNGQLLVQMDPQTEQAAVKQGYRIVYQSRQTGKYVFENIDPLPRAFFVDGAQKASQMEILNRLRNAEFNPKTTAFVEEDLPQVIEPPGAEAYAKIIDHDKQNIKLEVNATGNNLLVLGEIYYPPCWFAYIDGKEVPIHKTNYAMRSIIVPEGEHTIEFKYESSRFELGKTLSTITNILLVIAFGFAIYLERKKYQKNAENDDKSEK